ncbi:hypothetical protein A6P39_022210 [Streptomyces sp. FXJ1.172]|uniref:hypothetical protein n=1 Tax=Streptomyces sp. FXJ1.172 TaxID=710705 RepID=UPI0007CFA377|nr:hypothetical protein [Streptomyces sp. FXJ1.172]WEO96525.1 hypothetical protein A6P39_022210 [Streptomyces sp. FXJ1.172]
MINQILPILGVLIGALTSYLSTSAAERARHRRALATRWDERKLDTYVEYATCVKEIADLAKRAYQAPDGSDDREQFLSAMNKAEQKRSALFEALILLASPATTDAATAVNPVVWKVLGAARRRESDPREISLVEELNNYHKQARLDLGISVNHQAQ